MPSFKQQLHEYCTQRLAEKLAAVDHAVAETRESIAGETKSSAGDKYETAREMLQQEIDKYLLQRRDLQQQQDALARIVPEGTSELVVPGSVVQTGNGTFYIAVSIGKAVIEGQTVFIVSPASPVGSLLLGQKAGARLAWNGGVLHIISVA